MESVTEYKVRSAAADRLGIDLSVPDRKLFVRGVVENYLRSLPSEEEEQQQDGAGEEGKDKQEEEEEEDEEEEEEEGDGKKKREYDDQGDLILCRLSTKRRVTLSEFRGRTLVSIREFYLKDGKEVPSAKDCQLGSAARRKRPKSDARECCLSQSALARSKPNKPFLGELPGPGALPVTCQGCESSFLAWHRQLIQAQALKIGRLALPGRNPLALAGRR
ncbi:hypothetical protein PR202_ga09957 [Eleusine coracana subsp. coracana]|uniref:Transcriptional coactivator p15 (PC4) C-terminal domain-containing protein n=1 Tax=Eleusine coracana subsp. coracana TaxID=191504 RepID=A0AAV5C3Y5_ELECO|nr:hypothetical protein PR202_ga09957 [Eleusine coracana subsp. coracana]